MEAVIICEEVGGAGEWVRSENRVNDNNMNDGWNTEQNYIFCGIARVALNDIQFKPISC